MLAHEVAAALGMKLIEWHVKSTTRAQQGLYEYDAVSRLRDGQLGDARVHDIANYIVRGKLWDAFTAERQSVVLIDEIDKADIEFPNDLLLELDRMEFFVYETRQTVKAHQRPGGDHHVQQRKGVAGRVSCAAASSIISVFRTATRWSALFRRITQTSSRIWRASALTMFFRVRELPGLKKKPATRRVAGLAEAADDRGHAGRGAAAQREKTVVIPPLHGALLKNERDVHLFERLAFMARREG